MSFVDLPVHILADRYSEPPRNEMDVHIPQVTLQRAAERQVGVIALILGSRRLPHAGFRRPPQLQQPPQLERQGGGFVRRPEVVQHRVLKMRL